MSLGIPTDARPEPQRDRWGRYLFPPPNSQKQQAWTRATTWAKTIADTHALTAWGERMVAIGMARRVDLVLAAAAVPNPETRDGKDALNKLCEAAKEHAGASTGRTIGSALHSFTEAYDMGRDVAVPAPYDLDVKAYAKALKAAGLSIDQDYVEGIVCIPELEVAGTFDRLLRRKNNPTLIVGDLKTAKDMSYAWAEVAVQLALYSHASTIYDPATGVHTPMPVVDRERALVMHLPVGQATCTLYDVDIAAGWEMAQVCGVVRVFRKRKDLAAPHVQSVGKGTAGPSAGTSTGSGPGQRPGSPSAPKVTGESSSASTGSPAGDPSSTGPPPAPKKTGWVQQLTATTPPTPPTMPPDSPDDGALVPNTEDLKTAVRALSQPQQQTLRRWVREGKRDGVPWGDPPMHERQRQIAVTALTCAKHLWEIDTANGDQLTRAALMAVIGWAADGAAVGTVLGQLTIDQAEAVAALAHGFGLGDQKSVERVGKHLHMLMGRNKHAI